MKDEDTIPLSDGSGEVVSVGTRVTKWKKGDRVASIFNGTHYKGSDPDDEEVKSGLGGAWDGMLSQYVVLPEASIVRIPDHLSYEEAATLPCAAVTAYNALYGLTGRELRAGDVVLAEGTGGVSIFAMQFATAAGAKCVITSSSDEKLAIAKKVAPNPNLVFTINYKKNPKWDEEVLKLVGPVDHVVEVGGNKTVGQAFNALKRGGVVSSIGFVGGGSEAHDCMLSTLAKNCVLRGILVGSRGMFEDMNRLIDTHKIKPLVDKVFDFKDAQKAYEHQWSQGMVGKVVIRVS